MDKDNALIKKIGTVDDFQELSDFCITIADRLKINQISVQVSPDSLDFEQSAGRLANRHLAFKFSEIHPVFKNTTLDRVISNLPFKIWRTRIMVMPPKYKYTIHQDPTPRIHIPLVTNPECIFVFPDDDLRVHLPADGSVFWTDTRKSHTYENNSDLHRIHLVGIVVE